MKKIIVFLITSVVLSCNAQVVTYNPKAIELNNKAVDIVTKSFDDNNQLRKALEILDNAIKLDTSYYIAYESKATVLCKLKMHDSAIKTLESVILLHKNAAEVLATQGFILEKIEKKKEAMAKYQAAFTEYERLIKESPNKVEYQVNKAFLQAFIVNKETAKKSIDEIIMKYPDSKSAKAIFSLLNTFDRKQYIDSIGQ
jgi:tetratricopeptide (TPR) repeat protein